MNPVDFGVAAGGGWAGYRSTSAFASFFGVDANNPKGDTLDSRNLFYTKGQNLSVNDTVSGVVRLSANFTDGYPIAKWKNISSTGVPGSDPTGTQVDTDIPFFRYADVLLMYAEATVRGGSGDMGLAIQYVNQVRERAYHGDASHNVSSIDLDVIFSERSREFEWEAQRRTDLIRFDNKFTGGNYLWPWKGNVENGTAMPDYLNLYPLPSSDVVANPNLIQNTGY
jgi:hypothetical protein